MLDLQQLCASNHNDGAYARRIDYSAAPGNPISWESASWADTLLRQALRRQ